tara:strand:- start:423 stop:881 length:459 start_codon:yes stop_codon:yes gene_type:complete
MVMDIKPISLKQAQQFVRDHHRHNKPPVGHKFSVGLFVDGALIGVAVAGRPVARALDDGLTLEVTRTCTDGTRNANSKLYGAITRAAAALGYRRAVTYTQGDESGASLRGAGGTPAATLAPRAGWDAPSRPRTDIGSGGVGRIRWERVLNNA